VNRRPIQLSGEFIITETVPAKAVATATGASSSVNGQTAGYDVTLQVNVSNTEIVSLTTSAAFQAKDRFTWTLYPSTASIAFLGILDSVDYAACLDLSHRKILFKLSDNNSSGYVDFLFDTNWNSDVKNLHLKQNFSIQLFDVKLTSLSFAFSSFIDAANKRQFNLFVDDNLLLLPCN